MSPLYGVGDIAAIQADPSRLQFQGASPEYAAGAASVLNAFTFPVQQSFGGQVTQPIADPDALAIIRMYFASLGMDDPQLTQWATSRLTQGASQAQIELEFRDQPAVKKRFAGVFDYINNFPDLAPPSFADVLAWERDAQALMRDAGLPPGFYDSPEDFRQFVGSGVSIRELSERVQQGFLALEQGDETTRQEMQRLYGVGVTAGQIAAWALDEDRAVPTILRQVQAAQIGAAGRPTGFTLTTDQLESLAAYGVSQQQARQGFGELYGMRGLFGALPGEGVGDITQAQQLGAQFTGDVASQQAIERRQAQRQAEFQTGGQAIITPTGSPTFR